MIKTIKFFLFFSVLIILSACKSQTASTIEHKQAVGEIAFGLAQKTWYVYQDTKDDYWFGSNGQGLFHFDGKILKNYTKKDGLIDNTIRGIQGDTLGNVFIQTPEGVSKYDGFSFTSLSPISDANNEWKLAPNDLWFNCNGMPDDIYRYDGKHLYELKLPRQNLAAAFGPNVQGLSFAGMNSSPYSVYGIDKDKAGNLWIGTIVAGAFRYDGNSFLWFPEKELSTLDDGRVPGVRSILEDKNGDFWLSNFISKYKINETAGQVSYEKLVGADMSKGQFDDRLPYFNAGLSAKNGDLWMATYSGGVWKYDGENLANLPVIEGDTEILIVSIYEDNQGVFWLGTDNAGVYKFNGEKFESFRPSSLKSK